MVKVVKGGRINGSTGVDPLSCGLRVVTYARVSTEQQGRSGLGLEAQAAALDGYIRARGAVVVGSFIEVESGRRSDRPELARAIAAARKHRATLLVAKLDRLARSVSFVSSIMDSGVDFAAADMPSANRFTLHLMAAVAEHEADMISARTKAALAAAKARGVRLGGCRDRDAAAAGLAAGRAVQAARAAEAAALVMPLVVRLRAEGRSWAAIARQLEAEGVPTTSGAGSWTSSNVSRLAARVMAA